MSEPEGSARFDPQSEEWRQIWVDKENERKEKEDKKKELERKRVEREEMKQRKELEKNQNNYINVKRKSSDQSQGQGSGLDKKQKCGFLAKFLGFNNFLRIFYEFPRNPNFFLF